MKKVPHCVKCKTTQLPLMKRGCYKIKGRLIQRYACRKCNTEYGKKYRDTNENAWEHCHISKKKTVSRYPERQKARRKLNYEITKGRIIKPERCSTCHNNKIEAHHEDYSKPLEVVWLCRTCHSNLKHK